ncbi:MAG TPA: ABC transporter permease [Acidimicrobiia bacterium]|nr:ABC transporter permease [Acidimicrobiia bacterium]
MIGFVVRRLLALVPLLFIISFVVFALSTLIPGDPAVTLAGGTRATPESIAEVRDKLDLDDPFFVRYGAWLGDVVRGDLGESLLRNSDVSHEIANRFPVTFSVAIGALFVTVLIGVPLGILAGTRPGRRRDRAITLGTSAGIAIPDFWLAMVFVVFFSVNRQWLPSQGYVPPAESVVEWARHLVLPWLALGLAGACALARQLRGALADVLEQDYIRTAAAKGLRRRLVVGKHALKNASIAPLTVLGLQFAYMLGGTVILERIFSIPGMGQYFYTALVNKDLPIIQGVTLVVATTFVVVNLAVDVLYAYVNPRVRLG